MVIDSSAVLAILLDEPERRRFNIAIERDPFRLISAASVLKCALLLESQRGETAGRELDLLLNRAQVEIVPVDAGGAEQARATWRRFGRGRHPAALDVSDCISYGLSITSREPLLFKGTGFAQTRIRAVNTTIAPGDRDFLAADFFA
ncbi:MAG TPA: type II toxin-antitoxin system VapC family toxin [Solirubrobacteraceae bacterium]|nr:type II toxin-antitoxin system VapC family toxin [Solirubrobacteraceae bacterium]